MPYALELGLDDHAAAVVRRLWHDLEDDGITHMARSGARPHVSVGIWDGLDRDAAEAELTRFAAEAAPLPIALASVGFFPQVAIFLGRAFTPGSAASARRRGSTTDRARGCPTARSPRISRPSSSRGPSRSRAGWRCPSPADWSRSASSSSVP